MNKFTSILLFSVFFLASLFFVGPLNQAEAYCSNGINNVSAIMNNLNSGTQWQVSFTLLDDNGTPFATVQQWTTSTGDVNCTSYASPPVHYANCTSGWDFGWVPNSNNSSIHWFTACVDPSNVPVENNLACGIMFTPDVSCKSGGGAYIACPSNANGLGNVALGVCPTCPSNMCCKSGDIVVCSALEGCTGCTYNSFSSCDYNKSYPNFCNFTPHANDSRCIGQPGCGCSTDADCAGEYACGSGATQCHSYNTKCNTSNHTCVIDTTRSHDTNSTLCNGVNGAVCPQYACSGTSCASQEGGAYTTSNCNNACGSPPTCTAGTGTTNASCGPETTIVSYSLNSLGVCCGNSWGCHGGNTCVLACHDTNVSSSLCPSCPSGQINPHYGCSGTCTSVNSCGSNTCTGPGDTSCGGSCMLNKSAIKNKT